MNTIGWIAVLGIGLGFWGYVLGITAMMRTDKAASRIERLERILDSHGIYE